MTKSSRRDKFWIALAAPIGGVVIAFWVGPVYLAPLATWLQLVIAAACVCFIATIAIVSRRRARRRKALAEVAGALPGVWKRGDLERPRDEWR